MHCEEGFMKRLIFYLPFKRNESFYLQGLLLMSRGTLIFDKMCQINLFQSNDVAICLANESNSLLYYSKKMNRYSNNFGFEERLLSFLSKLLS